METLNDDAISKKFMRIIRVDFYMHKLVITAPCTIPLYYHTAN